MFHSWDSTLGEWSIFMDGKLLGSGYSKEVSFFVRLDFYHVLGVRLTGLVGSGFVCVCSSIYVVCVENLC